MACKEDVMGGDASSLPLKYIALLEGEAHVAHRAP